MKRKAAVKRYRMLKAGELVQAENGDECRFGAEWEPTLNTTANNYKLAKVEEGNYRRPISTKAKRK